LFRTFVKERKAFGGKLSDKQVIQHKLAALKTEIVIGRTFADKCIGNLFYNIYSIYFYF